MTPENVIKMTPENVIDPLTGRKTQPLHVLF